MNLQAIRRWAPWLALVVLFAIATTLLSWWQFARREERVEKINQVVENYDSAAIELADVSWLPVGNGLRADEWRPVNLVGQYLPENAILVRNRPLNGSPGFLQLVPFRTSTGELIVVERGWLPAGSDIKEPLLNPLPSSETTELVVRLRQGDKQARVDAAAEEAAHRHVGDELGAYGAGERLLHELDSLARVAQDVAALYLPIAAQGQRFALQRGGVARR